MAPDQSTQSDFAQSMPPAQPQPAQGHYHPQHQQSQKAQAAGYGSYPNSYGTPFQSYNQAYQPQSYAAQQQQQQQYQEPPPVVEKKGWWISKIVLHALALVLSIIGLALALTLIGHELGLYSAVASGPVFVAGILWSGAELITRACRKWKAGIHPGAHVGVCLLLWLGGGIAGGISATWAAIYPSDDSEYQYYGCGSTYNYDTNSYDYDDDCATAFDGKRSQFLAATVLTLIVTVLYFALFVGACVDTAKRNARAKRPIMVVSGPPYWGPPAQGWQPMPQYNAPGQQQSQQQYQSIPLENRAPSPMMTPATQQAPVERTAQESEGYKEYYSPSGSGAVGTAA